MQASTLLAPGVAAQHDWLYLIHKFTGLVASPFLLTSLVLAVGLTHTRLLTTLSESIYPSLPIPHVRLDEPVRPGSWDQALKVARLAVGTNGQVITMRDENTVVVQAFEHHGHDPKVARTNPQTQLLIDLRSMAIVRVQDKTTSLVSQAHGIHAIRFFGLQGFSIATISALALLVLLISGGMLARRDGKAGKTYDRLSRWHVRLGRACAVFVVIVSLTTLDFEFSLFGRSDSTASHPIPAARLSEPARPGSIDQARKLVAQSIGSAPRAVFVRKGGDDVKFSEVGDGIGGKSVWMNVNTMAIHRITDWRNDKQAFLFILHDGRFLGGMNAVNIYDVLALILWLQVIGAGWMSLRKRGTPIVQLRGGG